MSSPAPSSPFPITRAELFSATSTKLDTNLAQAFEHPEDNNYVRNKVNNISISIINNAKLNRKTSAYKLSVDIVAAVLAGLAVNFPDVQFVDKVDKNTAWHIIRVFWS